jgi:hypothetical protein
MLMQTQVFLARARCPFGSLPGANENLRILAWAF